MIDNETLRKMNTLRLPGMAELFSRYLDDPTLKPESHMDFIGLLVDAEDHDRKQRKQLRMMKSAKLKYPNACMEDIDYSKGRGLDKRFMSWVSSCLWIRNKQNILLTGPAGTGKTYNACAIGTQAIRKGYSVVYKRVPRLIEEFEIARGEGNLPNLRAKLQKQNVLILDEWALSPLTPRARLDLLEMIEDRAGTGSLIITSQMPIEQWHAYIGEPTIADAILDRIVHRAHKLNLRGESLRKLKEGVKEKDYV